MLLDSNVIIYASQPQHAALRQLIAEREPKVSAVSKVETLGYHRLGVEERGFLEAFFEAADVLAVSEAVVERAVLLRQRRKMTLGDALIAATALAHGLVLVTRNVDDFSGVEGLEVVDPLK